MDMAPCPSCNSEKVCNGIAIDIAEPKALKSKSKAKCQQCSDVRWLACTGDNYIAADLENYPDVEYLEEHFPLTKAEDDAAE